MTASENSLNSVGRPRSDQARKSVLRSTLKLINQFPPGDVTIKAIAQDAGVGRQTIYRWWNNRGQIILEALGNISRTRVGRSRTGELPTDILQFVRDTVKHAKSVRTALAVVMIDAQQDPLFLDQFRSDFIEVRRHAFLELMNSDPENVRLSQTDQQFLADLIYGPLWYRLLIDHAPLDRHFADRLAQTVLDWYARRSSDIAS